MVWDGGGRRRIEEEGRLLYWRIGSRAREGRDVRGGEGVREGVEDSRPEQDQIGRKKSVERLE